MIPQIAVLGASGFVGSRLVETFHLGGLAKVRPVVRSFGGLARLARFELDWRLAHACDLASLTTAFQGCESVVNLIVGDPETILQNAIISYQAAQAAGVKRLVFMSSASVHGQAPPPGTDETSPLHTDHPFPYNIAKVVAERELMAWRDQGTLELVILRPGIVFGPRSRWMTEISAQLLSGQASFIHEGQGICNSIYVDNLVEAIRLALKVPEADRQVFLVGDRERVTWLDFYRPIAEALGLRVEDIPRIEPPSFPRSGLRQKLRDLKATKAGQALLPIFSPRLKQSVKSAVATWNAPENPSVWTLPTKPAPSISEEMCLLQSCTVQLPWSKAARMLGYEPPVSFAEGMKRSLGWLRFAGYPVKG